MTRRNRWLAAALLVCGSAALFLEQPWRGDEHARTEAAVQPLFPRLARDPLRAARVELRGPAGETTTLVREADFFRVEERFGHPADGYRLRLLLDALAALDSRDTVSTNAEKRAVYGVDESGVEVRVLDEAGEELAALVAGRLRGQDLNQVAEVRLAFYVRPLDRDEVLLVEELGPPATAPERWLSRRFFPVEREELVRLERRDLAGRNAESWILERRPAEDDPATEEHEGHAWRMVQPVEEPATLYAGDSWAFTFSGLGPLDVVARATKAELDDPRYGFSTNAYRAFDTGGGEYVIYFGRPAEGDGRYAWMPGSEWIYTVPEHDAVELRMPVERMLADD